MKKITKKIGAIVLALMIAFTGFMGSYTKASASPAAILPMLPEIGQGVYYGVTALLAICGVGIAYDNRAEIEAGAQVLHEKFIDFVEETTDIATEKVNEWLESAQNGFIQLQGEVADCWDAFKMWVESAFFEMTVADDRPDISNYIVTKAEAFYEAYKDTEKYPYYVVLNRFGSSESFVLITETVPLIYYTQSGSLNYFYAAGATTDYSLNGMHYKWVKSSASLCSVTTLTNKSSFTLFNGSASLDGLISKIVSNVPIFSSKASALDWWQNNVLDGILIPQVDVPVNTIPDNPADVIWNRDGTLENYDVIGGTSRVDEDGKVIPGVVTLPGWDTLEDIMPGEATWEDVIGDNIPIDVPVDGTIDDAVDIPIPDGEVVEDSKPIQDVIPSNSGFIPFLVDLTNYFPFCIPFDLFDALHMFEAEPKAPHFEWTLKVDYIDFEYTFVLDLSVFNDVAAIFRVFVCILFLISLMVGTRGLISD